MTCYDFLIMVARGEYTRISTSRHSRNWWTDGGWILEAIFESCCHCCPTDEDNVNKLSKDLHSRKLGFVCGRGFSVIKHVYECCFRMLSRYYLTMWRRLWACHTMTGYHKCAGTGWQKKTTPLLRGRKKDVWYTILVRASWVKLYVIEWYFVYVLSLNQISSNHSSSKCCKEKSNQIIEKSSQIIEKSSQTIEKSTQTIEKSSQIILESHFRFWLLSFE